jgi:serine-type D-Ala-D-Ala carboxypeptidase (penicillin-binding protein 5/6)
VVAVVLVVAVAGLAVRQLTRPLPRPVLSSTLTSSVTVPGAAPSLPWPTVGQGAVAVPAVGYAASSGSAAAVSVASLTKITTAVVVLRDHPLPVDAPGPSITIGAADVAQYDNDLSTDQSTVRIQAGEVLTERQLLEALLTQSANDLAYTLAVWDAGSLAAFVVKMNALATSLGMTSTHYVDASGFLPQSVSSAVDVLKVAAVGMAIPSFAQVVAMTSVTLPVVGTLPNILTEVGTNGVIGIKSGYTSYAGGCMVLAADRSVAGKTVLVLAAVLAQKVPPPTPPTTTTTTTRPGAPPTSSTTTTTTTTPALGNDLTVVNPLLYTGPAAQSLLTAAEAALVPVTVATAGNVVGTAVATWGGVAHQVSVATSSTAQLAAWPGQQVVATHTLAVSSKARRGELVGAVHYTLGPQHTQVGLHLDQTVQEPSWWWRLTH